MAVSSPASVGCFVLANATITTPLTTAVQNTVKNLDGMQSAGLLCYFNYGSLGTNVNAHVQTSFDGSTWLDICDFTFTTSSATVYANITSAVTQTATAYAALSTQTIIPALLGNQLRAFLTTTGTYAGGTTAQVYVAVR